ncbi:WD40-repeat-containing domain protein [Chytriomyces cf. hyalinus JEL632]|nr:WD40-repeat-containing domain protein [Chytriomyces cf. hyalinus JEL632]
MFSDHEPKAFNSNSTWRKNTKANGFANGGCQTDRIVCGNHGGMSVRHAEKEIQTEMESSKLALLKKFNHDTMSAFLSKAEPLMSSELMKNIKSTAFDGYTVRWDEQVNSVSCKHTVTHVQREEGLACTQVAWSKTGTMLGVAYGHTTHDGWCTHKGHFCAWSLGLRCVNPEIAPFAVETTTCLTSIAFHPETPNIVAGGTFQGEILVWNMNEQDDPLIMASKMSEFSHQDPVSKVIWIAGSRIGQYDLVSIGLDGRLLIWTPMQTEIKLNRPKCGGQMTTANIPQSILAGFESRKAFSLDTPLGACSVTGFKEDPTTFIVGTEPGFIFKCNLATAPLLPETNSSKRPEKESRTLINPIQTGYTPVPHVGGVTSLSTSPFERDLILSCGNDGVIRLLHKTKAPGVLATWQPSTVSAALSCIAWSPHKATVFAASSIDGNVYFYNLSQNRHLPILSLPATTAGSAQESMGSNTPATFVAFNPEQPGVIAVSDALGYGRVFRVVSSLYECDGREEVVLQRLWNSNRD